MNQYILRPGERVTIRPEPNSQIHIIANYFDKAPELRGGKLEILDEPTEYSVGECEAMIPPGVRPRLKNPGNRTALVFVEWVLVDAQAEIMKAWGAEARLRMYQKEYDWLKANAQTPADINAAIKIADNAMNLVAKYDIGAFVF